MWGFSNNAFAIEIGPVEHNKYLNLKEKMIVHYYFAINI